MSETLHLMPLDILQLTGEVNHYMPQWVAGKVTDALNERGKAVKGNCILVLGLAYKKNIDDTRESPAVETIGFLQVRGAEIAYSDLHIPNFPCKRDCHLDLQSVSLSESVIENHDCLVLATALMLPTMALCKCTRHLSCDTRGRRPNVHGNVVAA